MNEDLLEFIIGKSDKPQPFEPGEPKFWDDPHISRSMLEAHLDQDHDGASRKICTIDQTIHHLFRTGILEKEMRVLDLGCGPGLYAERICKAGAQVVGLDISACSIEYARNSSARAGLEIEYNCMNFLDMDYNAEFDVVIQVYGELCTFSNENRDRLLKKVHRALKKGGIFIFDISTRELRNKWGIKKSWNVSEGGFWRQGRHLVLEQGFDYPENNIWLDQYTVIDEAACKVYRNWFRDYSLDEISSILSETGFQVKYVWNDLTGSKYEEGGDWIAVSAIKDERMTSVLGKTSSY